MSRRDQWKQVKETMFDRATRPRGVEEREKVPEVACGVCSNFSENAYASDGRGTCRVLKAGTNISADPAVYVTESDAGLMTFFNTDASRCARFARMQLIDKDGTECADPAFRRAQRQMEKINT